MVKYTINYCFPIIRVMAFLEVCVMRFISFVALEFKFGDGFFLFLVKVRLLLFFFNLSLVFMSQSYFALFILSFFSTSII